MTPKELAEKKMAELSPSVYIHMNKTTEDAYVDGFQDGYKEGKKRLLKLIKMRLNEMKSRAHHQYMKSTNEDDENYFDTREGMLAEVMYMLKECGNELLGQIEKL